MIPYKILDKQDISQAAKRINVAVLIDKRQSKQSVKEVINYVVDALRNDSFCKPRTLERFGTKKYEVVFLFIYDSMRQYNYGLPICRAQWIDPNCLVKPVEFDRDDEVGNIIIDWQDENEFMDDFIEDNEMEIGEYIKECESVFDKYQELFDEVFQTIETSNGNVKEILATFEQSLGQLYVTDVGFPKSNDELFKKMRLAEKTAIGYLHDITLTAKDSSTETFKFIAKTKLDASTKSAYEYKQYMQEIKSKYL